MKKLFGAAAAVLLLSAANAFAANVTTIKFNVKVNGTTHTCTMDVARTKDVKKSFVKNNILLAVHSDDCAFSGGGTIGQLDLDGSDETPLSNVATIAWIGPAWGEIPNFLMLVQLTSSGEFQDGSGYYVYGWEDIAAVRFLGKGKYGIVE